MRFQLQRLFVIIGAVVLVCCLLLYANSYRTFETPCQQTDTELVRCIPQISFEGFNNETGVDEFIVPNIVHFIRFKQTNFSFVDAVTALAAFKNQRPDKIMFHADDVNFVGPYWDKIKTTPGLVYEIVKITIPDTIYGQKFNKGWHRYHAGDVTRIKTLMKYGGIFLDNDSYIIRSLDQFRKFEMTIGWDEHGGMGNQVIIANKNARFLRLWLESYNVYHADKWYENAGFKPTEQFLKKRPELIHRVKWSFGIHISFAQKLYKTYWKDWRKLYSIHLLTNHRWYLDKEHYGEYPIFTAENIKNYNYTFGTMAREVYYGISEYTLEYYAE